MTVPGIWEALSSWFLSSSPPIIIVAFCFHHLASPSLSLQHHADMALGVKSKFLNIPMLLLMEPPALPGMFRAVSGFGLGILSHLCPHYLLQEPSPSFLRPLCFHNPLGGGECGGWVGE